MQTITEGMESVKIKELPLSTEWSIKPRQRHHERVDTRTCLDGNFAHHWQVLDTREGGFDSSCSLCHITKQFMVPGFETSRKRYEGFKSDIHNGIEERMAVK